MIARNILCTLATYLVLGAVIAFATSWACAILAPLPAPETRFTSNGWRVLAGKTRIAEVRRCIATNVVDNQPYWGDVQESPRWSRIQQLAPETTDAYIEASVGWPFHCLRWEMQGPMPEWFGANRPIAGGLAVHYKPPMTVASLRIIPYRPIASGLILNTLVFAACLLLFAFTISRLRLWQAHRRQKRCLCWNCGYNLQGCRRARCSECGVTTKPCIPPIQRTTSCILAVVIGVGSMATGLLAAAHMHQPESPPEVFVAVMHNDVTKLRELRDTGFDLDQILTIQKWPGCLPGDAIRTTPALWAMAHQNVEALMFLLPNVATQPRGAQAHYSEPHPSDLLHVMWQWNPSPQTVNEVLDFLDPVFEREHDDAHRRPMGVQPLHRAVLANHHHGAAVLIERGANPLGGGQRMLEGSGSSNLLGYAAYHNHGLSTALIEVLAAHGNAINDTVRFRKTALMIAAEVGNVCGVKALLECGADPALADANGETALTLADPSTHEGQRIRSVLKTALDQSANTQ